MIIDQLQNLKKKQLLILYTHFGFTNLEIRITFSDIHTHMNASITMVFLFALFTSCILSSIIRNTELLIWKYILTLKNITEIVSVIGKIPSCRMFIMLSQRFHICVLPRESYQFFLYI